MPYRHVAMLFVLLVLKGSGPAWAVDPYCPPNPDNLALGKSYALVPLANYDHPNPDIDNQVGALQDLADDGLVQIWVPHWRIYNEYPLLQTFYQSRIAAGEQVWSYNGTDVAQSHGDPYTEARLVPWEVHDSGLQGYGYWAMFAPSLDQEGSGRTSLWQPHSGRAKPYSTIYLSEDWDPVTPPGLPTAEGMVPTRRRVRCSPIRMTGPSPLTGPTGSTAASFRSRRRPRSGYWWTRHRRYDRTGPIGEPMLSTT